MCQGNTTSSVPETKPGWVAKLLRSGMQLTSDENGGHQVREEPELPYLPR